MSLGKRGEDAAAIYLNKNNYQILDRNWKCRSGELDIVAFRDQVLIVVEVKTRRYTVNQDFSPFAAVDAVKAQKLKQVTDRYLTLEDKKLRSLNLRGIRFDVIGSLYQVDPITNHLTISVEHMIDAFNY